MKQVACSWLTPDFLRWPGLKGMPGLRLLQTSWRSLHVSVSMHSFCDSIPAKIIMALAGSKGKAAGQLVGRIV